MKVKYIGYKYDRRFRIEKHFHEYWEVVLYTEGQGYVEIGGTTCPFRKGDVFVIPPRVEHSDIATSDFQSCFFTFDDERFGRADYCTFRDTENSDFRRILMQMNYEYNLKRPNYEIIIDSLYNVLLCYIEDLSGHSGLNPYVEKLRFIIIKNQDDPNFDLGKAMADIPLSEGYMRRLFLQETGFTPLRFLNNCRIERAMELLVSRKTSGLSIQTVALSSGFSSNYYFSRVFRERTGLSPRDWAKRRPAAADGVNGADIADIADIADFADIAEGVNGADAANGAGSGDGAGT